jgi:4-hydroxy-tetrahydrodipicolinate synthase
MKLEGMIPPVITPFKSNANQDLDIESLKNFGNFLLSEGVHGLVICAGNGEGVHLSPQERNEIVKVCVDIANSKVPVIVGVFSTATKHAINDVKQVKDYGADAALVALPYYFHHSDEGLYQHYKLLAEKADIPILIYNLRFFSGYDIQPKIVAKLADLDNIVGIKETTPNIWHIAEILRLCGNEFSVFAGNFDILLHTMLLGGKGCITGFINCLPSLHVELYDLLKKGDITNAIELYNKILPFWRLGPGAVRVKAALNLMGHQVGDPRKPLLPASMEDEVKLKEELRRLGYL